MEVSRYQSIHVRPKYLYLKSPQYYIGLTETVDSNSQIAIIVTQVFANTNDSMNVFHNQRLPNTRSWRVLDASPNSRVLSTQ